MQMPGAAEDSSVASITVAWNGANVLPRHLTGLLEQSRPLDEIVVVDNASQDGTLGLLRQQFPEVTVIPVEANLGMGGGLCAGLGYALERHFDWFWLFDQDSVPAKTALEELFKGLASISEKASKVGMLASLPVHAETGLEHFGLLWRDRFVSVPQERARQPVCFVDLVLSSGSLIRREVVEKIGLPRRDFFIDFVDHEYNFRVRRHGYEIALVRHSVLYHRMGEPRLARKFGVGPFRLRSHSATWRHYYMSRNEVFTVWHLLGTTKARVFLLFRMLRRALRVACYDEGKFAKLKMHFMGIRDGLAKDLTRGRGQLPAE
jgi:GT2 family glycosyltransferase